MHPFPITLWRFVLIFMWFLLSKVLANLHLLSYYKGIWLVFLQWCLIHMNLRCSPFWFLNLLEYLSKQFSTPVLVFCFSWQQLHSRFLASYLLASIRQEGWFFFVSNQVFWFFAKTLSFSFFLVTSECDVYLPVDHSLVYSYPKMLLLFFRVILVWFKTISLDSIDILVSFVPGSS